MAINKNFVVKNGLEVKSNLIVADGDTNKVGIGTTVAIHKLHVIGGIGATDVVVSAALTATTANLGSITANGIGATSLVVSGVSTFTGAIDSNGGLDVTGHTELDSLNVSGVSTFVGVGTFQGDLYVGGDLYVADDLRFDEFNARNLNISGIATIATAYVPNGTVSNLTSASIGSTNINITGVGTIATAYVPNGTISNLTSASIGSTNINVTGVGTIATANITNGTLTNLQTTGITTLSSTGGITTTGGNLYAGQNLYFNGTLYQNGQRYGIGIQTGDTLIGSGVTFIEFRGPGVSTGYYNSSSGIATVFFQGGGGGGGAIGIGSTFPGTPASIDPSPSNGDLFFHIDYGRTFIYYNESVLGVGSSAFWIDSSPFNVGIITALSGGVAFSDGSASSPSWYFDGDSTTGVFSPTNGQLTFVSTGSSVLNVNASGINVTGVSTFSGNITGTNATFTGNVSVGGTLTYEDVTNIDSVGLVTARSGVIVNTGTATTALIVNGDARVTGILTIGTSSVTLDGTNNQVNVGTGVTIHHTNGVQVGSNTLHSTGLSVNSVNTTGIITASTFRVGTAVTINSSGITVGVITATSFVGDGSGLTGAGATVANDTATNSTFYPLFSSITSGTVTGTKVSTTKLTFNPSTGTLTATDLNSSSDSSLKENIITVEDALDKVNNLRGVKFNWKEDGRASYGIIAQELEQVLPELVTNTDPKTVNYNGIIGVLIEAVKELTARVEELENKS
jgi:hypothetical protein